MTVAGCLQFSHSLGVSRVPHRYKLHPTSSIRVKWDLANAPLTFRSLRRYDVRDTSFPYKPFVPLPRSNHGFCCHAWLPGPNSGVDSMKSVSEHLLSIYKIYKSSYIAVRLVPLIGIMIFIILGLKLISTQFRVSLSKKDNETLSYDFVTSFLLPFLLWVGAIYICRVLDPIVLPTEASRSIKIRLVNFVRSSSTVLLCAYCFSGLIQLAQRSVASNDPGDARNITFQFAGKATYTAVWVAAALLFMELLGFSTQKLLTAGGLGTVLLTLVGREIFTNFLSSVMIHATRPFVVNEWIQTRIEGYEVSGFVERVGWWSPTIIRGEDQEALYIPNHKFTMNVVRNLSQKTHWRIKTHLAISHVDADKINSIVADMRKVLSKHPQVEQKRLHRRVFLEHINPENQGLMILISCFVKTSHFDEYLAVKEGVLMKLLRVIRHHNARLATPIRTMHKFYTDSEADNISFGNSIYNQNVSVSRPLLLMEPLRRAYESKNINGVPLEKKAQPDVNEDDSTPSEKSDKLDNKTQQGQNRDFGSLKQKPEKNSASQMEENLVLGVALDGSKRTLQIDNQTENLVQVEDACTALQPPNLVKEN